MKGRTVVPHETLLRSARQLASKAVTAARLIGMRLRCERAASVRHEWLSGPPECVGRDVCAFVTYAPGGQIPEHALRHADAWRQQGFVVVLIICVDDPTSFVDRGWNGHVDGAILRANRGYDFGAWSTAIQALPDLHHARRLVTVNDSLYGPLDSFPEFVRRLRTVTSDVVAAIESHEHRRHFQSFLLAFGPRALQHHVFHSFWADILVGDRREVIAAYELRLLDRMLAGGLTAKALFVRTQDINPTLGDWRALVDAGFPYVKVQLLRDNPLGADISGWRDVLQAHGYDPAIVDRHLGRKRSSS